MKLFSYGVKIDLQYNFTTGVAMKKFCVISHTHWDREWYAPFEVFRLRLVDLIDRLIDIIDEYPDYIFHLDAQTVVLEDYLEIKPERYSLLKKLIKNGNIVIGPWYLQNDYYLTSGESTIRNLLRGNKIANEFGRCMKVGYAPDQFGNVSQIPQILKDFGIDNFVFGRGFTKKVKGENGKLNIEPLPTEFIWEGADGTKCLAIHLRCWYNNAQRFSPELEKSKLLIDENIKWLEDFNVTPYILMMNGVDHLEAQDDLLPVLDKLNAAYPDYELKQYNLENYVKTVKRFIEEHDCKMYKHKGELDSGDDYHVLRGCWSSRSYLKVANVKAQNTLEKRLEPLYSFLEKSGMNGCYPYEQLRYAWRQLMRNHPHDSICGCSRDEVHAHMEDSFARAAEFTGDLERRGMDLLSYHNGSPYKKDENYVITVFNPTQSVVSGVVDVTVEVKSDENIKNFKILDASGKECRFEAISRIHTLKDVVSPINLPGKIDVDAYRIHLYVDKIQPVSARNYAVIATSGEMNFVSVNKQAKIENEYYAVMQTDGGIDVLIKATGKVIRNVVSWEETGDRGDSYVYQDTFEPAIYSDTANAIVTDVSESNLKRKLKVTNHIDVPAGYDFEYVHRKEEKVRCDLNYTVTLEQGRPYIVIGYEVVNRACDHRIRLCVNADIISGYTITDSAFDIISHTVDEICPDSQFYGFNNANFAALERKNNGVAVFSQGLHEVENKNGKLYFTVVRATGAISREGLKVNGGKMWEAPGNQLIRTLSGDTALYAYEGKASDGAVKAACNAFSAGLMVNATSMDVKKYVGGRPAVQGSAISDLFYIDDKYKNVSIKDDASVYMMDNNAIEVTAIKRAEEGNGFVVRLFNQTSVKQTCNFKMNGKIHLSKMSEKVGKYLGDDQVTLSLKPKQILTVMVF